jgi:hypothetical protein
MALRAMREGQPSRALPEYLTKEIYLIKPPKIGKHDHDCECYFIG